MKKIEIIARALILRRNKILFCKTIGERHYFLPGGRLKFRESAQSALSREIVEELGVESKIGSLIGICEHKYREKSRKHHEINFVFKVEVGKTNLVSKERKLRFYFKNLKELKNIYFLPKNLKEALFEYFKNKKFFWKSFKKLKNNQA